MDTKEAEEERAKIEYPKNSRGVVPVYKFPNYISYCQNYGGSGTFSPCQIDFTVYNNLKNWANYCWKQSQIRTYNSAIQVCRDTIYRSYLKVEDVENVKERLSLTMKDCKPEIELQLLFNLEDKEVADFILAEFEFLEWNPSKIVHDIWLMKNIR